MYVYLQFVLLLRYRVFLQIFFLALCLQKVRQWSTERRLYCCVLLQILDALDCGIIQFFWILRTCVCPLHPCCDEWQCKKETGLLVIIGHINILLVSAGYRPSQTNSTATQPSFGHNQPHGRLELNRHKWLLMIMDKKDDILSNFFLSQAYFTWFFTFNC